MSCIHDELIQKYIDGEATLIEITLVKNHISGCERCSLKIEAQRSLANRVKETINLLNEAEGEIPKFILPPYKKKTIDIRVRRYVFAISAACILFLMLIINQKESSELGEEIIFVTNFDCEIDANRTISQQEMIINMIDSDGNISEYHF